MSTTDHAVHARRDLQTSNEVEIEDGHAQLVATQALIHATLALVEEQRTANLIAALSAGFHLGHDFEDTAWADEIMPRLGLRGQL